MKSLCGLNANNALSTKLQAEFLGAFLSRQHGLHKGVLDAAGFHGGDCRMSGTALRSDALAQHFGRFGGCTC